MGREQVRPKKSNFSAISDGPWASEPPRGSGTLRAAAPPPQVSAHFGDMSSPGAPQLDLPEKGPVYRKSLINKRASHRAPERGHSRTGPQPSPRRGGRSQQSAQVEDPLSRAPRCPPVSTAAVRGRANTFPEHSCFPRKHIQHLSCRVFLPNVWHSFQRKLPVCGPSILPQGQQA